MLVSIMVIGAVRNVALPFAARLPSASPQHDYRTHRGGDTPSNPLVLSLIVSLEEERVRVHL